MATTRSIQRVAMLARNLRPQACRISVPINRIPKASFTATASNHEHMTRILSKNAMAPIGPYSQAIQTAHAIYCSGQLPADAEGNMVEGTMGEKTAACLKALSAILEEAGSSLKRVVKVQIFLIEMEDFPAMNTEYEKWIKHKPARSCIAVKTLPKNARIEIECVALPKELENPPAPSHRLLRGDWMCTCGYHNFAKNEKCRECDASRPEE